MFAMKAIAIIPIFLLGGLLLVVALGIALVLSPRTRAAGLVVLGLLGVVAAVGVAAMLGYSHTRIERSVPEQLSEARAAAEQRGIEARRALDDRRARQSDSQKGRLPAAGWQAEAPLPEAPRTPAAADDSGGLLRQAERSLRAKTLIAFAEEQISRAQAGIARAERQLAQADTPNAEPAEPLPAEERQRTATLIEDAKAAIAWAEGQLAGAKAGVAWVDELLPRSEAPPGEPLRVEAEPAEIPPPRVTASVEKPAPPAAKPASASPKPAWVETKGQLLDAGYEMSVAVGPYGTALECDTHLLGDVQQAVDEVVAAYLGEEWVGEVRLPPDYVRQHVVREHWEETVPTSFGLWPRWHVHLVFDRKTMDLLKEGRDQVIVGRRLWAVGTGLGALLLILAVSYAGLRTDLATRGAYRGRLALAVAAAWAAVVAGAYFALAARPSAPFARQAQVADRLSEPAAAHASQSSAAAPRELAPYQRVAYSMRSWAGLGASVVVLLTLVGVVELIAHGRNVAAAVVAAIAVALGLLGALLVMA